MQICSQFIASHDGGVWADHIRVTGGSGGQVGVIKTVYENTYSIYKTDIKQRDILWGAGFVATHFCS